MSGSNLKNASRRSFMAATAAVATVVAIGMPTDALAMTAGELLRRAYDNWRSDSSEALVTMTVHRPTWERTMTLRSYTRGEDDALVRFIAPAKEAGNATLRVGNQTWIFNPKLNRVVKLPASMLAQPWMGSDFSYSDLARSEDILKNYTHQITGTGSASGKTVYQIEAVPKRGAPVVWGKQIAKVREDGLLLELVYYDQGMQPVRTMRTDRIRKIGGRDYPAVLTMQKAGATNEWTRLETKEAQFDIALPDYLFTKSNLTNPRD